LEATLSTAKRRKVVILMEVIQIAKFDHLVFNRRTRQAPTVAVAPMLSAMV
jgi:hypothetical protein